MVTSQFPDCCNAKVIHGLHGATARQVKTQLAAAKRNNNVVVAITSDAQGLGTVMKAGGFKKVGDAKRQHGLHHPLGMAQPHAEEDQESNKTRSSLAHRSLTAASR